MVAQISALGLGLNVAGSLINKVGKSLSNNDKSIASGLGKLDPTLEAKLSQLDPSIAQKLKAKSKEFETVFLENMLSHMTQGTGEEGPLGENGTGGENYKSMLVNEFAKSISQAGGVGVSNNVLRELVRLQEASSGGANVGASK